ncbi:MAG: XTP/dITP diphosphatase [Thermoplasmata archaeon]|nr:MAG: XTP/dITP diphosphatase [Thermoplasmata archaeon]
MKIYFITSNEGKFNEVTEAIGSVSGVELERLELSYPEIQGETLEHVVKFAMGWLKEHLEDKYLEHTVMIEDSGLFVNRLKGFPGIYSAYVHRTIGGYNAVLTLMEGEWDRRAHFETCIGILGQVEEPKLFVGKCDGTLANDARGTGGFGYDPIFIPEGEKRTFAEMSVEEKNKFSHRGKALMDLKKFLADTNIR